MTRQHAARRAPALGLGVVGLLSLVVAAVAAAGDRTVVVLHACVADGPLAWFGLRFALLHPSADCPAGTLGVGGETGQVTAVLASVALPVVLLHALGVGAVAGVAAVLGRWTRRVGALVCTGMRRALVPLLPAVSGRSPRVRAARFDDVPPLQPRSAVTGPRHRGPPWELAA